MKSRLQTRQEKARERRPSGLHRRTGHRQARRCTKHLDDLIHPNEERAKELGLKVAEKLTEATGHVLTYHVESVSYVGMNESAIMEEAERIAAEFG